jgi:hypothetical protein
VAPKTVSTGEVERQPNLNFYRDNPLTIEQKVALKFQVRLHLQLGAVN